VAFVQSKLPFFMHSIKATIMELKILDELAIERGQPIKAMNICDSSWDGLTLDSFKLRLINIDSLSEDNITKENNLSKELTLFKYII